MRSVCDGVPLIQNLSWAAHGALRKTMVCPFVFSREVKNEFMQWSTNLVWKSLFRKLLSGQVIGFERAVQNAMNCVFQRFLVCGAQTAVKYIVFQSSDVHVPTGWLHHWSIHTERTGLLVLRAETVETERDQACNEKSETVSLLSADSVMFDCSAGVVSEQRWLKSLRTE